MAEAKHRQSIGSLQRAQLIKERVKEKLFLFVWQSSCENISRLCYFWFPVRSFLQEYGIRIGIQAE